MQFLSVRRAARAAGVPLLALQVAACSGDPASNSATGDNGRTMRESRCTTMELGYKLSSEEHTPNDLIANAHRAEEAGFSFGMISDAFISTETIDSMILPSSSDLACTSFH